VVALLLSQILNSLQRVGRFHDAGMLLRPIIACQQTLQYRNKTEVHSSDCIRQRWLAVPLHHALLQRVVLAAACSEVDAIVSA